MDENLVIHRMSFHQGLKRRKNFSGPPKFLDTGSINTQTKIVPKVMFRFLIFSQKI